MEENSNLERLLGWKIEATKDNSSNYFYNIYLAMDKNVVEIKWILQASFLSIEDALKFLLEKLKEFKI